MNVVDVSLRRPAKDSYKRNDTFPISSSSGSMEEYDQRQNISEDNFKRSRGAREVIRKSRGTLVMKHGALLKSLGK